MKKLIYLLLFLPILLFSQIKGKVVDENGKSISFVNIWVQDENIRANSEENGTFQINTTPSKNVIFTALGYEKKTVKASDISLVQLKTIQFDLDEVVIIKKIDNKQIEIGKTNAAFCQAFDNGPRLDLKFFPYNIKYKKTKFIKQISIYTDSRIENATIKIHLYEVEKDGFPGKEILKKDLIATVSKGTIINIIDIYDLNLTMPKNGIFVGFEKLIIERNKIEKITKDLLNNSSRIQYIYYPFTLYNQVERPFLYSFSGGKWIKKTKNSDINSTSSITIFEPAINLILSN